MESVEKPIKIIKVLNYGCSANRAIAEGIRGILMKYDYPLTRSLEDADVVIVNTCIVKQNTEHKIKSQLISLSRTKEIIVTGCLPVVMREWISQNLPTAKVLFPEVANQVIKILNGHKVEEIASERPSVWAKLYEEERSRYNSIISITEINRGCLGNCSFCIVKDIKGELRSRSPESILLEVQDALVKGSKEIWLTSQDTGVYGWDFSPKYYLSSLVDSITNLKGKFFVRMGMMTPAAVRYFLAPLIDQLNAEKVFSFLHLPIQTGSNRMLHLMRRKETCEYFLDLVKQLREEVPDLVLSTDIIVGFPGETQKDFEATKIILNKTKPEIVNISKYTDREGTEASFMPNKIPTTIKSRRSKELNSLVNRIRKQQLSKWLEWEGTVLIDELGKYSGQFMGRTPSYLPVVFNESNIKMGQFITARITAIGLTYLIGERIN